MDEKVAQYLFKKYAHPNWILEVKMKGGRHLAHQKVTRKKVIDGQFLWKPADFGARNAGDYICLKDGDYIFCVVDGKKVECDVNDGVNQFSFRI